VVAGIHIRRVDITTIDPDRRRTRESQGGRHGGISRVDINDERARGDLVDDLMEQRSDRPVVRTVGEPEELPSWSGSADTAIRGLRACNPLIQSLWGANIRS
jgi:hypothetical protein